MMVRDSWNEPKRVMGLEQVRVKAAFASGVVSAAVGDDGSLWTWGKSKRGQLGLGREVTEAVAPSKVEALAGEKIAKVYCYDQLGRYYHDEHQIFGCLFTNYVC